MKAVTRDGHGAERVLVLGSTGMLGAQLVPYLRACGHEVIAHGHSHEAEVRADLTVAAEVEALIRAVRPTAVVNLTANTDVDGCEADLQRAYLLNTRIVEHVANAVASDDRRAYLVQVSTDQVYDGDGLHREDEVTITNHYAMTKLAGELAALRVPAAVLRTNFFGRSTVPGRQSFTDWIDGALRAGRSITGFTDVHFSPLSTRSVLKFIEQVPKQQPVGVFNLGSREGMSKCDFMLQFARAAGLDARLIVAGQSVASAAIKAYRPKNMCMNNSKFERALGIEMPTLMVELETVARTYG